MSIQDQENEDRGPVIKHDESGQPKDAGVVEETTEDERNAHLKSIAEALVFSAQEPLTEAQFMMVAGRRAKGKLKELVAELNADYLRDGRTFEILHVAKGYQFFTRTEYAPALRRLFTERSRTRLSRAALETVAVVAFRGPVTRSEIDEIRGVESGGVLRTLLDRHLILVKGRADVIGRPLLYETSDGFLKHFGLSDLSDLPKHHELTREWGELQDELRRADEEDQEATDRIDQFTDSEESAENESAPEKLTSDSPEQSGEDNGHNELIPVNLRTKQTDPDS